MEHTPKNILLRAVRRVDAGMAETLQIHTTLQKLLEGELV